MSVNDIGSPTTGAPAARVGDGSGAEPKSQPTSESSRGSGEAGTDDRVSLTSTATALQQVEEQLAKLPDVDSKRVEAIKQAIENGSFEIDSNQVAEKLVAFDSALGNRGR